MTAGPRMPETREAEIEKAKKDHAHWAGEVQSLTAQIEHLQLDHADAVARRDIAKRQLQRLGAVRT